MEKDPPKSQCMFSLKRLFDLNSNSPSKKRKTPISLSKSRNNHSNSSSQQSQPEIKPEIAYNEDTASPAIIKKDECKFKVECVKLEESRYFKSVKLEPKDEQLPCDDVKLQQQHQYETQQCESVIPQNQPTLEEYACPICSQDLSHVRSSYLRQKHVEDCMLVDSNPQEQEQDLEFDDCVFCGKNLTHFNSARRQVHINGCLDEADHLEKQHEESMFAGQHVPFLSTLDLCPVCHEFAPFNNRTLKQKIVHIKQCAKQNQLSVSQLLKKFQWIGWGHLPVASATPVVSTIPDKPLPRLPPKVPEHQLVAHIHESHGIDGTDDDFSNKVIIHAIRVPEETDQRQQDKMDEELQTALAISKSLQQTKRRQGGATSRLNERDRDAASIWSSEDSKLNAMTRLDEILFPASELDAYRQAQREESNGLLGPSRFIPSYSQFYWNLPSVYQTIGDDPSVFTSLFIQDLHRQLDMA
ncbi:hypothetical protein [Parasitella parasitica]|uniref:Uncharacterized protein n=1 Tax=Parasitella parasitica TaxID=35722 RepID=A0A0B7NMV9_9FUNG|nr:hypothetical protein [Parasitella parasitica]